MRPWRAGFRLTALGAVVAIATAEAPTRASAQATGVITGTVTDIRSGAPVAGATIAVDNRPVASTDADGGFRIVGLDRGTHAIEIRRIGYDEFAIDVTITGADPEQRLDIRLTPAPAELDPVSITDIRSGLSGFYDRRTLGFGDFLTREEFTAWHPAVATDILRRMSGVRVRPNPTYGYDVGTGVPDRRRYIVETRRGGGITFDPVAGPECPVWYWLDGVPLGTDRDNPIDGVVTADEIEAVESYVGVQVPAQFHHPQARCGVIAFWTRRGTSTGVNGRTGSLVGGTVGAGIGVLFGLASPASCRRCLFQTERFKRAVADGIVFGLAGALLTQLLPGPEILGANGDGLGLSPVVWHGDGLQVGFRLTF